MGRGGRERRERRVRNEVTKRRRGKEGVELGRTPFREGSTSICAGAPSSSYATG